MRRQFSISCSNGISRRPVSTLAAISEPGVTACSMTSAAPVARIATCMIKRAEREALVSALLWAALRSSTASMRRWVVRQRCASAGSMPIAAITSAWRIAALMSPLSWPPACLASAWGWRVARSASTPNSTRTSAEPTASRP